MTVLLVVGLVVCALYQIRKGYLKSIQPPKKITPSYIPPQPSSPSVRANRLVASSLSVGIERGYQRTEEDERFEQIFLENHKGMLKKHFYTAVAGVTYANEDGTDRQALIATCESCELLDLVREPENKFSKSAVAIKKKSGQMLGYLKNEFAEEVSFDIDRGFPIWFAMVRKVTQREKGMPHGLVIVFYRLSDEYVKEMYVKSRVDPEGVSL